MLTKLLVKCYTWFLIGRFQKRLFISCVYEIKSSLSKSCESNGWKVDYFSYNISMSTIFCKTLYTTEII